MAVDIERVEFFNQPNCYKLSNDTAELILTTDIGPRIMAYRLLGEENVLAEIHGEDGVDSDFGKWKVYGGHRLWHAPEGMPRSYIPDNDSVPFEIIGGDSIRLAPPVERGTQIQKEWLVRLEGQGTRVSILHKLTNRGLWPVQLAPWALTVMKGGGQTIIPNEPFVPHPQGLLPARPMVLWPYTNLGDPRWSFGPRYTRLSTDDSLDYAQKVGLANKQGWAGYLRNGTLFIKRFPYIEEACYPDLGCNCETFTKADFMEVESVGPLVTLSPGESTVHVENWYLFGNVDAGKTEEDLFTALTPLVAQTV